MGKFKVFLHPIMEHSFYRRIVFDSVRRCCVYSNICYDEKLVEDKEAGKELGREVLLKSQAVL
jgi:hypothetical protein